MSHTLDSLVCGAAVHLCLWVLPMKVQYIGRITTVCSTSHLADPVRPHLSRHRQCYVGAIGLQTRCNSNMLQRWTRKVGCDGHGLFIDGECSEQGRGVRCGRGGGGLHGRMWCENKLSGLQTVEPTMACQIQVCPRFMGLLCKHWGIVFILRSSFPTVWPSGMHHRKPNITTSLRLGDRASLT